MRRAVATTHGLAKSEYLSLRGVRNMLDIGDREGLVDGCRSLRLPVRMRWTGLGPRVGGAAALALECASPCSRPAIAGPVLLRAASASTGLHAYPSHDAHVFRRVPRPDRPLVAPGHMDSP